jgi:hypothetical protein
MRWLIVKGSLPFSAFFGEGMGVVCPVEIEAEPGSSSLEDDSPRLVVEEEFDVPLDDEISFEGWAGVEADIGAVKYDEIDRVLTRDTSVWFLKRPVA